ncbi:hypothetical protein [Parapedobacter sp. 10938]|uniref:hypothetical protein n=1 Tax=Parapedobacter flavus TaxID=3110225 RepID=UPI002DBFB4BF|nr:hypothetical protein [Parapedobacter sp. 10938]MEC3881102.1 hypothetical protein [Parapedobacter sp. 10938]
MTSFFLSGCKRDIPPLPTDELRNVTFKLEGFTAETRPMDGSQGTARLALGAAGKGLQALKNIEPRVEPQYLYYWSFNNEDLVPDVAVDEVGAVIAFEGKSSNFVNGHALAPFEAGHALKITGASSLTISLPINAVENLAALAFDIKSSDTGPKDFSFLYSVDDGVTYKEWSASNQFEKTKSTQWNAYTFEIADFAEFTDVDMVLFKMVFLAGDRGEGKEYSESGGVVHLDNIRLSGVYNMETEAPTTPSTLHYYIFSSEDGSVVQQQQLPMDALGDGGTLDVNLADGNYDVLFVAYRSEKGVLLPENLTHASEFYFGQHFDDYRAVSYAALLESVIVDEANVEETVTLNRCYSLVEFDFTDSETNLQRVKKIEIVRLHDNFLYTPFGMPAAKEESEVERIQFSDFDFAEDHIALHQFFGLIDVGGSISYELIAYGEGDVILNTVTITEDLRNNQILRLTGNLLGDSGAINGFSVALDTEWEEILEHGF